jgi:lipid A ethanolaminephosphotransferase
MYLHGAPFMFAPEQQTRVPMVLWMSDSYRKRFAVSDSCLDARKDMRYSHDNLYHTVLGALGVTSARYQPTLDMFLPCRTAG